MGVKYENTFKINQKIVFQRCVARYINGRELVFHSESNISHDVLCVHPEVETMSQCLTIGATRQSVQVRRSLESNNYQLAHY